MKTRTFLLLLSILCLAIPIIAQQKDNVACKDQTLFTRMPDYWIHGCDLKQFEAYLFTTGQGKTVRVEGQYRMYRYYPQATMKIKPSELQILRNFENAVQKLGGKVIHTEKSKETFQLTKDGKDLWVEVRTEFTGKYSLTLVEKDSMAQDVVATAEMFSNDIRTTGHVAVYGIYFDTGKAELKTESQQAVGEISKLLQGDPGLKVYVVGHTDNAGGLETNMKLSQDRADAVIQALIRNHGISATRLKAFGNGPYSPVASNDAEEGKAKNRRVELVKQ